MRFFRIPSFTGIETHRDDADRGSLRVVEGCLPHGPGGVRSGPVWEELGTVDLFSTNSSNILTGSDDGKGNSVVVASRAGDVHDMVVFSTENTALVSLGASYMVADSSVYNTDYADITPVGNRLYAFGDGSAESVFFGKGPAGAQPVIFPDQKLYSQEWSRFPNCKFFVQGPKKTLFGSGNPESPLTVYISEPAGMSNEHRDSPYSTELTNDFPGKLSTVNILSSDASRITALSTRGDQVVVHTDKGCHLLYAPSPDQATTGYRVEQVPTTNFSAAVNQQVVAGESGSQNFWLGFDGQIYKDEAAARGAEDKKRETDQSQASWKSKGLWEKHLLTDLSRSFATYEPETGNYWVFVETPEYLSFVAEEAPNPVLSLSVSVTPDAPGRPENLAISVDSVDAPNSPENLTISATVPDIPNAVENLSVSEVVPDAPEPVTNLSAVVNPPAAGPTDLSVGLIAPAAGPTGIVVAEGGPLSGPNNLNAVVQGVAKPAAGPTGITLDNMKPQAGPAGLVLDNMKPQAGPVGLTVTEQGPVAFKPVAGPGGLVLDNMKPQAGPAGLVLDNMKPQAGPIGLNAVRAGLSITLNDLTNGDGTITSDQMSIIRKAADYIESLVTTTMSLEVKVSALGHSSALDNAPSAVGGVLGLGGVDRYFPYGLTKDGDTYIRPHISVFHFDPADNQNYNDLSAGNDHFGDATTNLYWIAIHELLHCLGIGQLWNLDLSAHSTGSYALTGVMPDSCMGEGYYTGHYGNLRYAEACGVGGVKIPLEPDQKHILHNEHTNAILYSGGHEFGQSIYNYPPFNNTKGVLLRVPKREAFSAEVYKFNQGGSNKRRYVSPIILGMLEDIGYDVDYTKADNYFQINYVLGGGSPTRNWYGGIPGHANEFCSGCFDEFPHTVPCGAQPN